METTSGGWTASHIHTMEYYSATNLKGMNLANIILSQREDPQRPHII